MDCPNQADLRETMYQEFDRNGIKLPERKNDRFIVLIGANLSDDRYLNEMAKLISGNAIREMYKCLCRRDKALRAGDSNHNPP